MEHLNRVWFSFIVALAFAGLFGLAVQAEDNDRPTKNDRGYGEDQQPAGRHVIGWGQQTRGEGKDGKLESEPFRITRPAKIDTVNSHDAKISFDIEQKDLNEDNVGAGFWLQDAKGAVHRFDRTTYLKLKMGYVLPAGEYRVYPNLPEDVKSAQVIIIVKTQ